jgi:hypothetical protein
MNKTFVRALSLLLIGLSSAAGVTAESIPEQFTGRIVDAGGAIPGATSAFVTIRINEFTTDEEVAGFVKLLAEEGQDALEDALWDLDIGWIRIGGSLGYPLSIARSFDVDGERVIRVVTDRPIQMFESMRGLRTKDYPFGIIELRLDENGKGEGRLIAAAQAEMAEGKLEIESYGTEPFRLISMSTDKVKVKKKDKKN